MGSHGRSQRAFIYTNKRYVSDLRNRSVLITTIEYQLTKSIRMTRERQAVSHDLELRLRDRAELWSVNKSIWRSRVCMIQCVECLAHTTNVEPLVFGLNEGTAAR